MILVDAAQVIGVDPHLVGEPVVGGTETRPSVSDVQVLGKS